MLFLKKVSIKNFKSFKDSQIIFREGLNIVIGKNGAGKSNLLEYIQRYISGVFILRTLSRRTPLREPIAHLDYDLCLPNNGKLDVLNIKYTRSNPKANEKVDPLFYISKKSGRKLVYSDQEITVSAFGSVRKKGEKKEVFLDDLNKLRDISKRYVSFYIPRDLSWFDRPNRYEMEDFVYPTSEGFTESMSIMRKFEIEFFERMLYKSYSSATIVEVVMDDLKKLFFASFQSFLDETGLNELLRKYTPIEEIRVSPNVNISSSTDKMLMDNLVLEFYTNNAWFPWRQLSSGTKRFKYLITECLSISNGILLIEEPELGIHPHQLFALMDFLKLQSKEKQVIISTHSPMVLDILDYKELNRINVVKFDRKGSHVQKLNSAQIEKAQAYMKKTGELSYYWLHSDLEN